MTSIARDSIAIPIAHLVHLKEDYKNVKLLLEKFKCDSDKWDVCGDIKVLGFLIVLQGYEAWLYQVFMISLSVNQRSCRPVLLWKRMVGQRRFRTW